MTVTDMLSRLPARELSEWMAYFNLEQRDMRQRELQRKAEQGLEKVGSRRRVR